MIAVTTIIIKLSTTIINIEIKLEAISV
jgi:hypothetical protein